MKQEKYFVRVDKWKHWTSDKYHEVTCEELDALLDHWGKEILSIVSNGRKGVMAMWACFKSRINGGCYSDMINAYQLLTDDHQSLVDREHELRHKWKEYEELWRIRYYGSVHNYYKEKAKEEEAQYNKRMEKGVET